MDCIISFADRIATATRALNLFELFVVFKLLVFLFILLVWPNNGSYTKGNIKCVCKSKYLNLLLGLQASDFLLGTLFSCRPDRSLVGELVVCH